LQVRHEIGQQKARSAADGTSPSSPLLGMRFILTTALFAAACAGGNPPTGGGTAGSGQDVGHGGTPGTAGASGGKSAAGGAALGGAGATNGGAGASAAGAAQAGTLGAGGANTSGSGGAGAGAGGAGIGGSSGNVATGGRAGGAGAGGAPAGAGGRNAGGRAGFGGASGAGGSAAGAGGAGSTQVGATPPMGWNSWNQFGCNPSESLLKGVADAMVSSGMSAVGYEYVNIDDCWMSGRDSSGVLQWDKSKFPSGIPALAEYVHGKGLKLGIYETPSNTTCAGKTGGLGHESQDAQTFASWGVDYLKYDLCQGQLASFAKMHDALLATGRPIFYSVNPFYGYGQCVPPSCSVDLVHVANMWRIEFDISANWGSFTGLIDYDKPLAPYAGPGHWNDPDMLEVGRGMSADEDKSHFGMWAMLAAPLITGNDLRSMSATTKAILTNPDVIAVDQDPLGKQATVAATPGTNLEVWSRPLAGTNTRAVALFNRSGSAASIAVTWSQLGLPAGAATVRDLYAQKDLGSFDGGYTATAVPSHGIAMLKVVSSE
jgi:alpha-galactosidase